MPDKRLTHKEVEAIRAVNSCAGNRAHAARQLGIGESALRLRLQAAAVKGYRPRANQAGRPRGSTGNNPSSTAKFEQTVAVFIETGSYSAAARILGVDPGTVRYRLWQWLRKNKKPLASS